MGEYNYSPAFLKLHADLVDQLIALARTHEAAEARFPDTEGARRYRNLILNLKRSLALNQPEMAFVHNTLRTRVSRSPEGEWIIRVGPESLLSDPRRGKMRGRMDLMIQPDQLAGNVLSIPGVITAENYLGVMQTLAEAKVRTKPDYIQFEEALPPDAIPILAEKMGPEYEVLKTTPKLIFERQRHVDASAIIASAQDRTPK